jgi:predicted transcriptional regulator
MNNNNIQKSQNYLIGEIIRSGRLNALELGLLNVISSYSESCRMTHAALAKSINRSVATVKRLIKSLIDKGIITKAYTYFKRCVLKIISPEKQRELLTCAGVVKQAMRVVNKAKQDAKAALMRMAKKTKTTNTEQLALSQNTNLYKTINRPLNSQEFELKKKLQIQQMIKAGYLQNS